MHREHVFQVVGNNIGLNETFVMWWVLLRWHLPGNTSLSMDNLMAGRLRSIDRLIYSINVECWWLKNIHRNCSINHTSLNQITTCQPIRPMHWMTLRTMRPAYRPLPAIQRNSWLSLYFRVGCVWSAVWIVLLLVSFMFYLSRIYWCGSSAQKWPWKINERKPTINTDDVTHI